MSYASGFELYISSITLGILVVIGAWLSLYPHGDDYNPQWRDINISPSLIII